jgi:hypothetical protein
VRKKVKMLANGIVDEGEEMRDALERSAGDNESDGDESVCQVGEPLGEDLYGASITSLLRDLHSAWQRPKDAMYCIRLFRLSATMLLLTLTVGFAVFILGETKLMITPDIVENMREVYSRYEHWMYNNHTRRTVHGYQRGIPGYFNPERFSNLTSDTKANICDIPLAHPFFTAAVLVIWSCTVVVDLRAAFYFSVLLLWKVETVSSVHEVFIDDEGQPIGNLTRYVGRMYLQGLTVPFKACLMVSIFLPRMVLDIFLLWLGCRWLLATQGLENLLLNAVALEFVLGLKDLLYKAVVPARLMAATRNMIIKQREHEPPTCISYVGSFAWLFVVAAWVYIYMTSIQGVLPDFHWDVSSVCKGGVHRIEQFLKNLSPSLT